MNALPVAEEFRKEEVAQLFAWARAGESASIVGVHGVGKSNLVHRLLDPQVALDHLGEEAAALRFVRVDFHDLADLSPRSIYSLILEQLERTDIQGGAAWRLDRLQLEQVQHCHDLLLENGQDPLKAQRYFKRALDLFLGSLNRRLVLLFDHFDEVYRQAEASFLSNLRGFREAYKYRLMYFVFTHMSLSTLTENDDGREEFHELLRPNVLWLRPYHPQDAAVVLNRMAARHKAVVAELDRQVMIGLSGGHAGLLRAIFLLRLHVAIESLAPPPAPAVLVELPAINSECEKVWDCLTLSEKRILKTAAEGISPTEANAALGLVELGLLAANGEIFSPLFTAYTRSQKALWERPIYLDETARQVWVMDQPKERLTGLEFRLFRCLWIHPGQVVDHDALFQAGWPADDPGGVSNEALSMAISRIRKKIEPDPENPRFLLGIREQGYQLMV
jgi:DNA-binding winged helix-turn-helix (wHTH) protein/MoxR-like ATPase